MLTHFWALGLAVPADITPAFFSGGLWNLSVVSRERGTEKKHARTCIKFHLNLKSPFNVWTFISLILYTCIPHIPYQLQTTYNIHRPLILSFIFHFMNFWPICTACSLSIHGTFEKRRVSRVGRISLVNVLDLHDDHTHLYSICNVWWCQCFVMSNLILCPMSLACLALTQISVSEGK